MSRRVENRRYGPIPNRLYEQLLRIEPSHDGDLRYFPCLLTLADGRRLDSVYVMEHEPYIRAWGVWPEDDPDKKSVRIEDVVDLQESPSRLPAWFANELYREGESGMGYCVFTIVFRDGLRQKVVTGNAVDFVPFPPGCYPGDIVGVEPHTQPWKDATPGPDYRWCLYDRVQPA